MICCKMDSSFDTSVPEMSELDFDLGTMDTFEDLDINMTAMDMISSDRDPFGDFSLEQSFNLIELNKLLDALEMIPAVRAAKLIDSPDQIA